MGTQVASIAEEIGGVSARTAADDPAVRPQIALLPGAHRRAEGGHPWVYSNEIAIDVAAKALPPGTLVTLAPRRRAAVRRRDCSTRMR